MTNVIGSTTWLVDQISAEVVRLMHLKYCVPDLETHWRIEGLRWALCLLKGWDPSSDSWTGERADQFIRVWHNLPGHCTEDGCGSW